MASIAQHATLSGPFIKICGITHPADVALCAALGVNAVGLLLVKPGKVKKPDDDRLSVEEAAALVAEFPRGLLPVLLVHTAELEKILGYCDRIRPGALQVQERVAPQDLLQIKRAFPSIAVIQTFFVAKGATVGSVWREISGYADADAIDAILLDSERGGSGEVHDWAISAELVARSVRLPTLLAGGLNPDNVREALRSVRPFGVDVMRAVTNPDLRARKDSTALRAFVQAVRAEGNAP